ncbi:hypothetical protein Tco_1290618 [Tanacetum coccineum]
MPPRDKPLLLGLKRLHGFLEVTAAQVHNGNYAKWFGISKWYQSFALRNFDLEDTELESTNSGPTAKLPILKLVPQTSQENGVTVTKMSTPSTAEEKTNKKNDVKVRGLLLMTLPNEYQLTFSQYPDAKSMFAAIKTRFGGNAATKKTQKTLLKQQYENFSATSANATSPSVNVASPQVCTASVSDNNVYAFMVENPNGSNVLHQDLEQIHEDDLEAMDLKWQLSLLSVRAKKYYQRTGKKIVINANDIAGYDKSKLEKVKQEKDGIDFKIEKFDKASKDLYQLLGSQMTDKSIKGLGYNVVPLPHPLIYNRPNKLDQSYSGLDEFKEPEFKGYGPENSKQEFNVVCEKESDNSKENSDESLVKEQVSQDKSSFVESLPNVDK